jgi:hypothetical protein
MKHVPAAIDGLTQRLHLLGWSHGYCAKRDESGGIIWVADARKRDRWVKAYGSSLTHALWKPY